MVSHYVTFLLLATHPIVGTCTLHIFGFFKNCRDAPCILFSYYQATRLVRFFLYTHLSYLLSLKWLIFILELSLHPTECIIIPWMYLWPINDSLSQFLHIPVGHWLRVCKPSSKYLQNMWHIGCEKRNMYCIAENFRGIKTFTNFEVREPSTKVFFTKFWGMPHPLMFDLKQSVKVFSMKFSLPTAVKVFSHESLPL